MNSVPARAVLALALLLAALVHAPSLTNDFAGDDRWIAMGSLPDGRENALVRDPAFAVSHPYWGAVDAEPDPLYRPTSGVSHALCWQLVGDSPWLAHALNLLLHVAATALLAALVAGLGASPMGAAAAALFFAVHGIHSEAVAQVVGRAELLAFCFGAGALLLAKSRRTPHLVLAGFSLLFAFGSKESALAWAVLLGPWMLWTAPGDTRQKITRTALIAAPPLLLYFVFRSGALAATESLPIAPSTNPLAALPFLERLPGACTVQGHAATQLVLPLELRPDYSRPVLLPRDFGGSGVLGVFAWALALTAAWFFRSRAPWLAFAALAWMGFSALTANVIVTIGTVYGERLMFAPSIGIACAFAGLLISSRRTAPVAWTLAVLWCGWNASLAWRHAPTFRDDDALLRAAAEASEPSGRSLHAWAAHQSGDESRKGAVGELLRRAVTLDPDLGRAWNDLALLYIGQQRKADARAALESGIRAGEKDDETRFVLHQNLASLCVETSDFELARRALLRLAAIDESRLLNLATPLFDHYARTASVDWIDGTLEAIQAQSPQPELWMAFRGERLLRVQRLDEAERLLREAIRELQPGRFRDGAELWLAETALAAGRKAEARELAGRLLGREDLLEGLRGPAQAVFDAAK